MDRRLLISDVQDSLRVGLHLLKHKLERLIVHRVPCTPIQQGRRVDWPDQALPQMLQQGFRPNVTVHYWDFFELIRKFFFFVAFDAVSDQVLYDLIMPVVSRNINRE